MSKSTVRLLATIEHACGYYPERVARNLVVDPECEDKAGIYDALTFSGFRRSGNLIFRPHCARCQACHPTRLPVSSFQPSRSQRRCLTRNADLEWRAVEAQFSEAYFELYSEYLDWRHPNGGMDNPGRADFCQFLLSDWCDVRAIEVRLGGVLVAVAICDVLASGLSAVYNFYDPAHARRGLGTYCVLQQIELARQLDLDYLYLGYWLPHHPKMDYKMAYQPLQVFRHGRWSSINKP